MPHELGHKGKVGELFDPTKPGLGTVTKIGDRLTKKQQPLGKAGRQAEKDYIDKRDAGDFTGSFRTSRRYPKKRDAGDFSGKSQDVLDAETRARVAREDAKRQKLSTAAAASFQNARTQINKLTPDQQGQLAAVARQWSKSDDPNARPMSVEDAWDFLNKIGGLDKLFGTGLSTGVDPTGSAYGRAYTQAYDQAWADEGSGSDPEERRAVAEAAGIAAGTATRTAQQQIQANRPGNILSSLFGPPVPGGMRDPGLSDMEERKGVGPVSTMGLQTPAFRGMGPSGATPQVPGGQIADASSLEPAMNALLSVFSNEMSDELIDGIRNLFRQVQGFSNRAPQAPSYRFGGR